MPTSELPAVNVRTRDGECRCFAATPSSGKGPWPAVIVYMDAFAIRPAMLEVAARIARLGYFTLLPDLYYRSGPYEPIDASAVFGHPDAFQKLREQHMVHVTMDNVMSDTATLMDFLQTEPRAQAERVGTTGYCMGGKFALAAAAHWPQRVRACASFHGGGLVTGQPDSVHLLAPRMKARVMVAGATGDSHFTEAEKQRLEDALRAAGVDHRVETWPAKHGWTFRDLPVYDKACSERHFETLRQLYADTLHG